MMELEHPFHFMRTILLDMRVGEGLVNFLGRMFSFVLQCAVRTDVVFLVFQVQHILMVQTILLQERYGFK